MSVRNSIDRITVSNLLKADPFGEKVYIIYPDGRKQKCFINKESFFSKVYVEVGDNQLEILDGARKSKKVKITEWMRDLNTSNNSLVIFIEGYAGCGKSVFVQYLLKEQLKTLDYEYNYYNYDIGAHYQNFDSNRIMGSIRECFLQQLAKCIEDKQFTVIAKFKELMKQNEIEELDALKDIFYKFTHTNAFHDAIEDLKINRDESTFRATLHKQMESFKFGQILALDCLFRIARYITTYENKTPILYICYDNMDSIENFQELSYFENTLKKMRRLIDNYINVTDKNFGDKIPPRFVFLTTYRKITAAKIHLSFHSERSDDYGEDNCFVQYIDASCLYNYQEVVKKREKYFLDFIKKEKLTANKLKDKIKMVVELSEMNFIQKKYAGLWNNNYRNCCDIMEVILNDYEDEAKKCIIMLKNHQDGYVEKGLAYVGASSVFLSLVCKVFDNNGIWGKDHMGLVSLENKDLENVPVSQLTSLSRLVLTYISNAKDGQQRPRAVSSKEIFHMFGSIYTEAEICNCIANMLIRDNTNTWRRPIYYHRYAIDDNQNILDVLLKQWTSYKSNNTGFSEYTEFMLCECGEAYINRIVMDFEFYSVRKKCQNSLYLEDDISKINDMVKDVYEAVEGCCKKMVKFSENYKDKMHIKDIHRYVELPIHPRTNKKKPQLHTERTIFSHIAYLNSCRDYHICKSTTIRRKKQLNKLFVNAIGNYLKLYREYIEPMNSRRNDIVDELEKIVANINNAKTEEMLFQSVESTKKKITFDGAK